MKLNELQKQLLLRLLQSKWKERTCNSCDNNAWNVPDILYEMGEYFEGAHMVGQNITPYVTATCVICGNMKLFNAIALGLVDVKTGKVANG